MTLNMAVIDRHDNRTDEAEVFLGFNTVRRRAHFVASPVVTAESMSRIKSLSGAT